MAFHLRFARNGHFVFNILGEPKPLEEETFLSSKSFKVPLQFLVANLFYLRFFVLCQIFPHSRFDLNYTQSFCMSQHLHILKTLERISEEDSLSCHEQVYCTSAYMSPHFLITFIIIYIANFGNIFVPIFAKFVEYYSVRFM